MDFLVAPDWPAWVVSGIPYVDIVATCFSRSVCSVRDADVRWMNEWMSTCYVCIDLCSDDQKPKLVPKSFSPPVAELMMMLQPSYVLATGNIFFQRSAFMYPGQAGRSCRFVAVAPVLNCYDEKWLYAFKFPPSSVAGGICPVDAYKIVTAYGIESEQRGWYGKPPPITRPEALRHYGVRSHYRCAASSFFFFLRSTSQCIVCRPFPHNVNVNPVCSSLRGIAMQVMVPVERVTVEAIVTRGIVGSALGPRNVRII